MQKLRHCYEICDSEFTIERCRGLTSSLLMSPWKFVLEFLKIDVGCLTTGAHLKLREMESRPSSGQPLSANIVHLKLGDQFTEARYL